MCWLAPCSTEWPAQPGNEVTNSFLCVWSLLQPQIQPPVPACLRYATHVQMTARRMHDSLPDG